MAFQPNDRPQRQTFDVSGLNLKCAECDAVIDRLPFEPTLKEDGTYGKIFCFECNRQRRRDRGPRDFRGGGGSYR